MGDGRRCIINQALIFFSGWEVFLFDVFYCTLLFANDCGRNA